MKRLSKKRPGRHRVVHFTVGDLPDWFEELPDGTCLRSVAEDAFTAKFWADKYGASFKSSCVNVYNAGVKALAKMGDQHLPEDARSKDGTRAARKFWEAKVCAREAK
jgi:hypothetical protein